MSDMVVPVIGSFRGETFAVYDDGGPVALMPLYKYFEPCSFEEPGTLLERAARVADALLQHDGDAYIEHPVMRWMMHKGLIEPVAKEYRSPYFYNWKYRLTEHGVDFARKHAAPLGEW